MLSRMVYGWVVDGVCRFFFFKQKTAYEIGTGDWSSDVCSSDLTVNIADIFRSYTYNDIYNKTN